MVIMPYVAVPYLQQIGPNATLQQDHARPHTPRADIKFLQQSNVLDWPACSPDLKPDITRLEPTSPYGSPEATPEHNLCHVRQFLQEEWDRLAQSNIQTLVNIINNPVIKGVRFNNITSKGFMVYFNALICLLLFGNYLKCVDLIITHPDQFQWTSCSQINYSDKLLQYAYQIEDQDVIYGSMDTVKMKDDRHWNCEKNADNEAFVVQIPNNNNMHINLKGNIIYD